MIVMTLISVIFKTKKTPETKHQTLFYSDSPISWASGNITFSGAYQAAAIE